MPPPRRSIVGFVLLLAALLLPAALYAFYVFAQLEDVRRHDLRGLDSAARAAQELLVSSRTTVRNLLADDPADRAFACEFFQRQAQLELKEPADCRKLPEQSGKPRLEAKDGKLYFAADCKVSDGETIATSKSSDTLGSTATSKKTEDCVQIEVVLSALLAQVPFGESFDQLLVADDKNVAVGESVSPQRSSPMLPPRVLVRVPPPPVRALGIAPVVRGSQNTTDPPAAPAGPAPLQNSTFVRDVDVAGTRFALMCQPWRIELDAPVKGSETRGTRTDRAPTWSVCGLKDTQRSFREALEVAPNVVVLLLAFLLLAVIGAPILKVLSLAPQERLRFADMFLMLLGTLGLVMLLSTGVADIATYNGLRERSADRLQALATSIDVSLNAEIRHMHKQLADYDRAVEQWLASTPGAVEKTRVGCLLREPQERRNDSACKDGQSPLALPPATSYPYLQAVFWATPCDGTQIVKGTPGFSNSPLIPIGQRAYFQAIGRNTGWTMPGLGPLFVDTGVSFTTGGFFAALAMPSGLTYDEVALASVVGGKIESGKLVRPAPADCTPAENERFVAALTSQLVSTRYPVLAPGVGFAIVDSTGRAVAHSDERRATFENLLDDDGLRDRLRAALTARTEVGLSSYYQTLPHQIHVRPMAGLPWTIITFVDDEVLRTFHVELLGRTSALIALYLFIALGVTLLYMFVFGRQPPVWMWPRREPDYWLAYRTATCSLLVQLAFFLMAVDLLSGLTLLAASVAMPSIALVTVALSAGSTTRPDRAHLNRSSLLTAAAAGGVGTILIAAEHWLDPIAGASARPGVGVAAAIAFLLLAVALACVPEHLWGKALQRYPLLPHTAGTVLVWLIVGALPAYALFAFALARQTTVATMAEQAYVGRAEASRACRIADDARLVASGDARYIAQRISLDAQPISLDQKYFTDRYPSAQLAASVAVPNGGSSQDESTRASTRFWDLFGSLAPVYNETTIFFRYLEIPPAGRWTWIIPSDGSPVLRYVPEATDACDARIAVIASRPVPTEPALTTWRVILGVAFLGLLATWVSYGTRRLFFGAIEDDDCVAGPRLEAHREHLSKPADEPWLGAELDPLRKAGRPIPAATITEWLAAHSTRRDIAQRVLDHARPHYDLLWWQADDEEKLVLVQLAQEGFANPKQTEVVRRLLRKGLLRRDPILRFMNHSFALFVERTIDTADVVQREKSHRGFGWSHARTLLIGAFVLVLLFLSFTQRDTVQTWLAYLTTAAGLAAGVFKLVGFVSRPGIPKE